MDTFGLEYRVGGALRRIMVVVETGGAECKVEIGDDRIQREITRDRPGDVVGDGGCTDATFCADNSDDPPDGSCLRRREQTANRAHHVPAVNRRNPEIPDPAPHPSPTNHTLSA